MTTKYALITPCRDEAAYLQTTIDSITGQTVKPTRWIIVDDGSTDSTPEILKSAAQKYSFIKIIRREDRGERSVGPGVIDAFYAGLATITIEDFDYICKLDGDLELPEQYFESLMQHFTDDPWLGTLSGKLFVRYGEKLVEERCGDENSVGPAKFYKVECFKDINGFVRAVCWDGIDGHMCRMNGWKALSINDINLQIIHLRRMGSSYKGIWTGRLRWGRGKYFMGSRWYYMVAVSLYRVFERPYFINGIGILVGYLQAAFRGDQRFDDQSYLSFFRKYELESLLFGKRNTMKKYHDQLMESLPQRRTIKES